MSWYNKLFSMFGNGFNSFGWNTVRFMNPEASFNNYGTDRLKIQAVFTHPAVLKVWALNCDIASLGEIYVYKDNKDIGYDPILDRFESPNPWFLPQSIA